MLSEYKYTSFFCNYQTFHVFSMKKINDDEDDNNDDDEDDNEDEDRLFPPTLPRFTVLY